MRSVATLALLAIVGGAPARAEAQTAPPPERVWVSVNGGVQPGSLSFTDDFDLPLYQENEQISTSYPIKGGAVFAASAGYRVWHQLVIGVGVSRYHRAADATVSARVPHPFFDNQFRTVEGPAPAARDEVSASLQVGWMLPVSPRLRLLVTAGPSVISVRQTIVTGLKLTETYPYDTAAFASATTIDTSRSATGFGAGADLFWMFSRNVGAGALVQFTHAHVTLDAGSGHSVGVDAGGAQAGAGIRFVF